MAGEPNQDELKAAFIAELGEDGYRLTDFKKRGWDSLMCSSAVRAFAAKRFGWAVVDEATFYTDNKLDMAALSAAHDEIKKSTLYSRKLEDAESAVSGKSKINLDKVVERFF